MSFCVSSEATTQAILQKYPVFAWLCEWAHGSGIDCEWHAYEAEKTVILTNEFHTMNSDSGIYEAYVPFAVVFSKANIRDFYVQCTGSRYYWNKHALRDYLTDTIAHQLEESIRRLINLPAPDNYPIRTGIRKEEIVRLIPAQV